MEISDYEKIVKHLLKVKEFQEFRQADPKCMVNFLPVHPDDLPRILQEYPDILPKKYLKSPDATPRLFAVHVLRSNANMDIPRKIKLYIDVQTGEVVRSLRSQW